MISFLPFWIAGFVALVALAIATRQQARANATKALVLYASIFVAMSFWSMVNSPSRGARGTAAVDADKTEVLLRLESAVENFVHGMPMSDANKQIKEQREKLLDQVIDLVEKASEKAPDDPKILARLVIVSREVGRDIRPILGRIEAIKTEEAEKIASALRYLYVSKSIPATERKEIGTVLESALPPGWYRSAALYHFYKVSKQNEAAKQLAEEFEESNSRYLLKMGLLAATILLSSLTGLGVILVQLFFLPRRVSTAEERAQIASPVPFGFITVYGVFIAWLSTQLLIGMLAQSTLRSLHLGQHGVVTAALVTALFYIVSNAPGLVYVYILALRPHGQRFLEGIRLRFKVGRTGPFRLALYGLFTWFAAVPLVIICYAVAAKYMGSQGSSNPIIALVMQAAGSENTVAIVIFYITLGVLAPVCEETIFRGFLYPALRRSYGVLPSMLVTGGLFAAVHLDPGGFLPLMCLGALFCFVVEKTKSIFPSMIAHGLWNSGTFTMVLFLFGK